MKAVPTMGKSTVLKFLACGLLVFLTAGLQAQLIKQIKFSAAEGYTNGPLFGQPRGAGPNVWTCVSDNQGNSWTNANGTPWIVNTVTNGAMYIWPDQNFGTNTTGTINWAMPFPVQTNGPITVTWDWQFFPTNKIPPDYDPTNNNYNAALQGTDVGFTLSDSANRMLDGIPFAVFNELSTPNRMGGPTDPRGEFCDARHGYDDGSGHAACDGGGDWRYVGPEFKDGKRLHMKLIAYFGNPSDPYNNSYDVWAQRDGEQVWQTADHDGSVTGIINWMRRCPTAGNGIDCITMWLNAGTYPTHITVSNIRIVGPNPIAPTITQQPQGTVGYWGGDVQFGVGVEGALPFSYQWYKEGSAIAWGTNSTLTLTNLAFTDAASYWVAVTNLYGSTNSASALLVVNPAGVWLGTHPFLTITGTVGKTFGIEYTTQVSQTDSWSTLTNFTLTQPVQEWIDTSVNAVVTPKAFYRVVPIP